MLKSGAHEVIIIGGGIAGTAAAWFLARQGVDVLLLERGELNARASGANAGSIHLQIPVAEYQSLGTAWAAHFAPTLRMMRAGAELWETLEESLGTDLEFRRSGGIIAAKTDQEMEVVKSKAALEGENGIQSELPCPSPGCGRRARPTGPRPRRGAMRRATTRRRRSPAARGSSSGGRPSP